MTEKQREGALVKNPMRRLTDTQVSLVDEVSRELLQNPGLLCYNAEAARIFKQAGAETEDADSCVRVRISNEMIDEALESAPSKIVLGARDPDNKLILDSQEPRVRFGSGSETNVWLDVKFEGKTPIFTREKGGIDKLRTSAHLCENLEHLDFFIRNVNIQDKEVNEENKDVNKYLASLNNITKHVQAGLTSTEALDDVMKLGEIIAGGKDAFERNPVLSFITCVIKSPLQMVDDTAEKLIEISRRRAPVVISSCPMAGATGPFDEFGMVAQINAELLAGVVLNQLVSPGAPVLYGSVPVRTRLDNLNDMYGAPEFNHYNVDCAQMAGYYALPCYSTAGVGDVSEPGIQATVEKLLTLMDVPRCGAQYIHYAFGLLERTNVFCPEQAVMDNEHIGIVKEMFKDPSISAERRDETLSLVREVMQTDHKTFMYHLPLPTRDKVYVAYPLEDPEGGALMAAQKKYRRILELERKTMSGELLNDIRRHVPGILPQTIA